MFNYRSTIICLPILMSSLCCTTVAAEPSSGDIYEILEWAQLVPENWRPPIIAPAYDDQAARSVDRASLVSSLHNRKIRLPGFMKPQVFEGNTVSEFLLVPFLQHHVKQHAHLESNQMVYVILAEPLAVENPLEPMWVTGTITLNPVSTEEGPAGYTMVDAVLDSYEY